MQRYVSEMRWRASGSLNIEERSRRRVSGSIHTLTQTSCLGWEMSSFWPGHEILTAGKENQKTQQIWAERKQERRWRKRNIMLHNMQVQTVYDLQHCMYDFIRSCYANQWLDLSVNASTAHFTPAVFILITFLPMRERERESRDFTKEKKGDAGGGKWTW